MTADELSLAVMGKNDGCLLKCRVQPRSSRNAVVGLYGEVLKIALTAPPVDGKANRELLKFLSSLLRLSPGRMRITVGAGSRNKTIFIPRPKDSIIRKLCSSAAA